MKIIGITGPLNSGKSQSALFMQKFEPESIIIPFAKALKDFAFQMGWDGKKDERGRRLLQLLGTDVGRKCISEDIWVKHWWKATQVNQTKLIIADDLRFNNEAQRIKENGGIVIQVVGRCEFLKTHESEMGIDPRYVDHFLPNDGTLIDLQKKCDIIVDGYLEKGSSV